MRTLKTNFLSLLFFIMLSSCTFNASLRNLETELGKGDQSSSPVNLQKIFVDITSITLTEGSVAIINVAVNPVQTTDTIINLNLTTSGSSYIRFNPIPSQIIIPAGSTSKSVVLNTLDDSLVQDQEMWSFTISSPDPNLQADPGILNVTLNDNDGGVIPGGPSVPAAKILREFNAHPAATTFMAALGKVFYVGSDATNGSELWVSDGTASGTRLLKDIEPGSGSPAISQLYHPANSPFVFFIATTLSEGREMWVTDGTEQGTHMVTKGFEPGAGSGNPTVYLSHDDKIYYSTLTTVDGREIYVSDGTHAGTRILIEMAPGTQGLSSATMYASGTDIFLSTLGAPIYEGIIYRIDPVTAALTAIVTENSAGDYFDDNWDFDFFYNGVMYYSYYDWSAGYELHASKLTNATTGLLKDIYPGWTSSYAYTGAGIILNGKVFVGANSDSASAYTGYYLTDGTTAGTVKVTQSIGLGHVLGVLNGKLLVRGCVGNYDCELYSSAGVNGDATLIKDIYTGTTGDNANSGSPAYVATLGSKFVMTATTAAEGSELWVTDGTTAGTVLLKDIYPGSTTSSPSNFVKVGSKLYFTAKSNSIGEEIWVTDGTPAGTVIFKDLVPGTGSSGPKNLVALDSNRLFFTAYNSLSNFASVFIADISTFNVVGLAHAMVESLNSGTKNLVEFSGLVYFDAQDSSVGNPLWVTNGTAAATTKIKDLFPMSSCTDINYLTVYKGSLFFSANTEANGLEIHISDGTTAGTSILKDLNSTAISSQIGAFTKTDSGNMFFTGNHDPTNYGTELYTTDGTPAGTVMVKDINPGATASIPSNIVSMPGTNKVIFMAWTPKGYWVSDGTSAGTVQLSLPSLSSVSLAPFPIPNGAIVAYNETSTNKIRIYAVNGLTNAVTLLNTTYATDMPTGFFFLNPNSNTLYYHTNNSGGTSLNLWKTDGTVAGTTLVKNIPTTGNNHVTAHIGFLGNKSFFQYGNNTSAPYIRHLWVTDGTSAGTFIVDDATATQMQEYSSSMIYNGYIYFSRYHATSGREIWKTDGTIANTSMVKDINPGIADSDFTPLAVYNGKLYFSADDGVNGMELWRTDGTLLGTELVSDINPGSAGSDPSLPKVLAGKLYFLAYKVLSGREVWVYSE